jgi:hypothetical protein
MRMGILEAYISEEEAARGKLAVIIQAVSGRLSPSGFSSVIKKMKMHQDDA